MTCILAAEGAKPTSARRLLDAAAADTLKMLCDVMKTEAHAAAALSDDDVEDPTFARALQSFYSACGAARECDDDDDESETFAMLEHFRALGLEIPPEIAEALRDERATAAAAGGGGDRGVRVVAQAGDDAVRASPRVGDRAARARAARG